MRRLIWIAFLIALTASPALTQTPKERGGYGYGFAGLIRSPNGEDVALNVGIGGDGYLYKGFGVGGEIGYVGPSGFNDGFGILSANASYHFLKVSQSRKLVPFLTGGFSLFFRSRADIGGNFGGGVTYWFKERIGVRLEVRDQIPARSDLGHLPGFRAAVTFR
ncbi:MAG: hypothetical protein L0226_08055 [Acidobacteria bacterium]|nr:hypothetical protein [Acidobacteriota bacterium]